MDHNLLTTALLVLSASSLVAQSDWVSRSPANSPPGRSDAAMVYDAGRGVHVLFGGMDRVATVFGDTWEWNGTDWSNRSPAVSPPDRRNPGVAYDSLRGVVVLFGGFASFTCSGQLLADTWEWDGSTWTQRSPANSPSPRLAPGMATHPPSGKVVLFGGSAGGLCNQAPFGDTWEWDGVDWQQLSPATAPPPRFGHGMVFDPVRGDVLLFGGFSGPSANLTDTWTWDGASWQQQPAAQSPPPRGGASLTFDVLRDRTLLVGGSVAAGPNAVEFWEWDRVQWYQRFPATNPPPRAWAMTSYDIPRQELLLFGGRDTGLGVFADTWTFRVNQPAGLFDIGGGCSGSVGTASISELPGRLPWVGDTADLRVAPLAANVSWLLLSLGFQEQSFDLTPFGLPGCTFRTSGDAGVPLAAANGAAFYSLVIPNDPVFAGLRLRLQALIQEPGANAAGVVLSDAVRLDIGLR